MGKILQEGEMTPLERWKAIAIVSIGFNVLFIVDFVTRTICRWVGP